MESCYSRVNRITTAGMGTFRVQGLSTILQGVDEDLKILFVVHFGQTHVMSRLCK